MRGTSLLAALGLVILASTAVSWQVSPKPSYSDGCFSSVIEDPGDISLNCSKDTCTESCESCIAYEPRPNCTFVWCVCTDVPDCSTGPECCTGGLVLCDGDDPVPSVEGDCTGGGCDTGECVQYYHIINTTIPRGQYYAYCD